MHQQLLVSTKTTTFASVRVCVSVCACVRCMCVGQCVEY